ncbi:ornithine carbamoyltransferase [Roseateles sp.]|uniref:ornithine carbamoyltransferase n=1 Tax=Roseateles sp. TaxID=1971397 RepID=UPI00395677F3
MNLISLSDLSPTDIRNIWRLVGEPVEPLNGTVAWSFEGNGIRTRTTFIQAFRDLDLQFTELPNLLKTGERARDLAGYLDAFYDLYVVRESDHARLVEFAAASRRPVVNAMSGDGHPCEVLTDAYYVDTAVTPLERARVCLWGPPTNVFRSWHELARVLGFTVAHVCEARFHECKPNVLFSEVPPGAVDVVITDAWPQGLDAKAWSLSRQQLEEIGNPRLLPTPPFKVGGELDFDPVDYAGFCGYAQKELLVPVQKAIVRYVFGA